MAEMTMKDAIAQMVEPMGKTLDDIKDVLPNGLVPTHLYILFKDSTYAEVELTYPQNA